MDGGWSDGGIDRGAWLERMEVRPAWTFVLRNQNLGTAVSQDDANKVRLSDFKSTSMLVDIIQSSSILCIYVWKENCHHRGRGPRGSESRSSAQTRQPW